MYFFNHFGNPGLTVNWIIAKKLYGVVLLFWENVVNAVLL